MTNSETIELMEFRNLDWKEQFFNIWEQYNFGLEDLE